MPAPASRGAQTRCRVWIGRAPTRALSHVARAQTHFQRLQKGSWDDAQFANGAEAMSAVLELVRRHQARAAAPLPHATELEEPGCRHGGSTCLSLCALLTCTLAYLFADAAMCRLAA